MVLADRGIQNSEISKMLVGIQKSLEGAGRRGPWRKETREEETNQDWKSAEEVSVRDEK